MYRLNFFALSMILVCTPISSHQFIYPVACGADDAGDASMYCIWQKSPDSLELLAWDLTTHKFTGLLHSIFNPAGFRLLPDGSGFSFIDNGRIRIKKFNKRSIKSLSISEPITDVCVVDWATADCGYFSAKRKNKFCIFKTDQEGNLQRLAGSMTCDCLYPNVINNTLFYIERTENFGEHCYEVVQMHCPQSMYTAASNFNDETNFDERVQRFMQQQNYFTEIDYAKNAIAIDKTPAIDAQKNLSNFVVGSKKILDFGNRPIAFLRMLNHEEGFLVEYCSSISLDDTMTHFFYIHLKKHGEIWTETNLFKFSLPSILVRGKSSFRLYESIYPLLPVYEFRKIYYMQGGPSNKLNIFCYDMHTQIIEQKTFGDAQLNPTTHPAGQASFQPSLTAMADTVEGLYSFAPVLVGDRWFYGGQISGSLEAAMNGQEFLLPSFK